MRWGINNTRQVSLYRKKKDSEFGRANVMSFFGIELRVSQILSFHVIDLDICRYDNISPTKKERKMHRVKDIFSHSITHSINSNQNPYIEYFKKFAHINHQFKNYNLIPAKTSILDT